MSIEEQIQALLAQGVRKSEIMFALMQRCEQQIAAADTREQLARRIRNWQLVSDAFFDLVVAEGAPASRTV